MAPDGTARVAATPTSPARKVGRSEGVSNLQRLARRRSSIAFLMTLPLILIVAGLVAYPAAYAIYLSTLNRRMTANIGLGNFEILLESETFWMVIWQSCFFAVTAVLLKALIGFWLAHMLHHIPTKGQRKWRGMLLIPWVIPPALSTLGWWWMFDPAIPASTGSSTSSASPTFPGWASPGGRASPWSW